MLLVALEAIGARATCLEDGSWRTFVGWEAACFVLAHLLQLLHLASSTSAAIETQQIGFLWGV